MQYAMASLAKFLRECSPRISKRILKHIHLRAREKAVGKEWFSSEEIPHIFGEYTELATQFKVKASTGEYKKELSSLKRTSSLKKRC